MFKTLDLRLQIARGRKQVVHDRATSRAVSYRRSGMIMADKSGDWSGDWLGDNAICCAIRGTDSRLVVQSVTISYDWLHDPKTGRTTIRHLLVVSY